MKNLILKPSPNRNYYHIDLVNSEHKTLLNDEAVIFCYDTGDFTIKWEKGARKAFLIGRNCGVYVVRSENTRYFGFSAFQFLKKNDGFTLNTCEWVDNINSLNELVNKYGAKECSFVALNERWVSFIKNINKIDFAKITMNI